MLPIAHSSNISVRQKRRMQTTGSLSKGEMGGTHHTLHNQNYVPKKYTCFVKIAVRIKDRLKVNFHV